MPLAMKQKMRKIDDLFPDGYLGNGIFSAMYAVQSFPWLVNNAVILDMEYYGNISGNKYISPMLEKVSPSSPIQSAEKTSIANVLISLYYSKWEKLYATTILQYDPIQNYDMVEVMTNDQKVTQYGRTQTRTDNLTHTKTGTETDAKNTTDTRTDNLSHTKTGTETSAKNTTDTRTDNLTHTKTGTETSAKNTTDTRTDNLTHTKTGTETIENGSTDTTENTRTISETNGDTQTLNLLETTTPNLATFTRSNVYGFNTVDVVPNSGDSGSVSVSESGDSGEVPVPPYNFNLGGLPSNATLQESAGVNTVAKTGTDAHAITVSKSDHFVDGVTKSGESETTYNTSEGNTGTQATAHTGRDTLTYNTTEGNTGTQATAHTGQDTLTYNTTEGNTGTQTDANSGSDTETRNYRLTRSGNIGVTTSQQMIEAERKVRMWTFFHSVVFPDVDRVLALQIY